MPDGNGQMQLQDYVTELKARGFDGYSDADLKGLVNRGYFYVARKTRAYWSLGDYSGAVPANGQLSVSDTGSLVGFKNVEAVYWKNGNQYIRMRALSDEEFRDVWLPDFQEGVTANPEVYYIDGNTLWILPKMSSVGTATIELRYAKRPLALTSDTAVPITPVDLDEVILTAAIVRCHKRANETSLAIVAQSDLDEAFDDIADLESTRMSDQLERTSPDDTWL